MERSAPSADPAIGSATGRPRGPRRPPNALLAAVGVLAAEGDFLAARDAFLEVAPRG